MPLSKADFLDMPTPVPGLFPDQETSHDAMMLVVNSAMLEAKKNDYFPDEHLFLETMRELRLFFLACTKST